MSATTPVRWVGLYRTIRNPALPPKSNSNALVRPSSMLPTKLLGRLRSPARVQGVYSAAKVRDILRW